MNKQQNEARAYLSTLQNGVCGSVEKAIVLLNQFSEKREAFNLLNDVIYEISCIKSALTISGNSGPVELIDEANRVIKLVNSGSVDVEEALTAIMSSIIGIGAIVDALVKGAVFSPGLIESNLTQLRIISFSNVDQNIADLSVLNFDRPPLHNTKVNKDDLVEIYKRGVVILRKEMTAWLKDITNHDPLFKISIVLDTFRRSAIDNKLATVWWTGFCFVQALLERSLIPSPQVISQLRTIIFASENMLRWDEVKNASLINDSAFTEFLTTLKRCRSNNADIGELKLRFSLPESTDKFDDLTSVNISKIAQEVNLKNDVLPFAKAAIDAAGVYLNNSVATNNRQSKLSLYKDFIGEVKTLTAAFAFTKQDVLASIADEILGKALSSLSWEELPSEAQEAISSSLVYLEYQISNSNRADHILSQFVDNGINLDIAQTVVKECIKEIFLLREGLALHVELKQFDRPIAQSLNSLIRTIAALKSLDLPIICEVLSAVTLDLKHELATQSKILITDKYRSITFAIVACERFLKSLDQGIYADIELLKRAEMELTKHEIYSVDSSLKRGLDRKLLQIISPEPDNTFIDEIKECYGLFESFDIDIAMTNEVILLGLELSIIKISGAAQAEGFDEFASLCSASGKLIQWLRIKVNSEDDNIPEARSLITTAISQIKECAAELLKTGKLTQFILAIQRQIEVFVFGAIVESTSPSIDSVAVETVEESKVEGGDNDFDEQLLAIYRTELATYISAFSGLLKGAGDKDKGKKVLQICSDLVRIFHQVKGISRTVGNTQLSEVFAALESVFQNCVGIDVEFIDKEFDTLLTCLYHLENQGLKFPSQKVIPARKLLVKTIRTFTSKSFDDVPKELNALATVQVAEDKPIEVTQEIVVVPEVTPSNEQQSEISLSVVDDHSEDAEEFFDIFEMGAEETIPQLNASLKQWLQSPTNLELSKELKRHIHSLKGTASMIGQSGLVTLCHQLETLFENIAVNIIKPTDVVCDLVVECVDVAVTYTNDLIDRRSPADTTPQVLRLQNLIDNKSIVEVVQHVVDAVTSRVEQGSVEDDIQPEPSHIQVVAPEVVKETAIDIEDISTIVEQNDVSISTDVSEEDQTLVQILSALQSSVSIGPIQRRSSTEKIKNIDRSLIDDSIERAGEISGSISIMKGDLLNSGSLLSSLQDRISRALWLHSSLITKLRHQANSRANAVEQSSEISLERFNSTSDVVVKLGEVLARAVEELSELVAANELLTKQNKIQRKASKSLVKDLFKTRVVPVANLHSKFQAGAQTTARATGKKINFSYTDNRQKIDRTLLEGMVVPFTHIINNCIDHGIEAPSVRLANGKPEEGTVTLDVAREGRYCKFTISDDGRGLDEQRILNKAIGMGIIDKDAKLTSSEIFDLILRNGFSTADSVTQISGRGVGMDAVKQAVDALRGTIEISSQKGLGATFVIRIPSLDESNKQIIFSVNGRQFCVPSYCCDQIISLDSEKVTNARKAGQMTYGAKVYDYIEFSALAGEAAHPPLKVGSKYVLLISAPKGKLAVEVDDITSSSEIYITSMSGILSGLDGIYGFGELGSGELVLSVDIVELLRSNMTKKDGKYVLRENRVKHSTKLKSVGRNVLVIDDTVAYRQLYTRLLSRQGWNVFSACNGAEGLEQLSKSIDFTAVVVDAEMPVMDGFEFTRIARSLPRYETTPILMMSTLDKERFDIAARDVGVTSFIEKSVDNIGLLSESIERSLSVGEDA